MQQKQISWSGSECAKEPGCLHNLTASDFIPRTKKLQLNAITSQVDKNILVIDSSLLGSKHCSTWYPYLSTSAMACTLNMKSVQI